LFTAEADRELHHIARITRNEEERNFTSTELAQRIGGYDAILTGWGTPQFTPAVLAAAGNLRLIAHTAGSIKRMLPLPVFEQGISVTHAAGAIAPAVAELTLLLILLCLRRVHELDRMFKQGSSWSAMRAVPIGQELGGQRVGIVGAGYTGRQVIGRLKALGAELWVYDPYLSAERAEGLGVHRASLDELFAHCPIVTMQAPPTAETYQMVGAKQLALLADGAIFINTARSHLVDEQALLAELQTGRFQAALDVFDQEPLPEESPFCRLDNVVLTPHIAGASRQARTRQGTYMVDELRRFFAGEPLQFQVTAEMLDNMA
jgi:phosphoglycerate dehydrogenase-like enzyme